MTTAKESINAVGIALRALGARSNVEVAFDSVDADDQKILDEHVPGLGICFSLVSNPQDRSATSLWLEARKRALELVGPQEAAVTPASLSGIRWPVAYVDSMCSCRLGRWLDGLKVSLGYNIFGIALVDGGIESVVSA
ncbi:MAG TPA: hypothetical protein VKN99_13020, partial [Polyangia bacterium]|nr:hypothetical protein [Polyangia bacterium]